MQKKHRVGCKLEAEGYIDHTEGCRNFWRISLRVGRGPMVEDQ